RESLALLLKGISVSDEEAQQYMDRKNGYYLELVRAMTPANLLPGAKEILEELGTMGFKRGIVSSSKNTPLVLERLQINELVDGVVDGNAPARSKPFPDLFLLGAKLFDLSSSKCLVVEDATAGVEAAHAAGMKAVGLGPIERVGQAELVLPSLEGYSAKEILELLGEGRFLIDHMTYLNS
ncbi:MAG TPA: HAD-IA family hydrolase, partial [Anaerolineaceae bacterium]|nr:HAD-IA family hydrolase [Anaerolineaceae bacterium]